MRTITLFILSVFISAAVFAQSSDVMVSKKGYKILPETGDYVIGFDAVPVLNFALNVVNIMNNTGQTATHPGFVSGFNNVLVGKYFVSENVAYRVRLGINTSSNSTKFYGDNPLTPSSLDPENILLQTTRIANNSALFGGGIEYRRGHNRLQGFYGAEALLGFSSNKTNISYEIAFDQTAQDSGYIFNGSSRNLSTKSGTSILFGVRGFVGVEYFVLPKISIGAEFGWGLGYSYTPRGTIELENWGVEPTSTATAPYQYVEETKGPVKSSGFGFGVDSGISQALMPSAALTMLFHF